MKFGGRVVVDVVLLDAEVDVETRDGRRATGFGSMPMGNAWGWPSRQVSSDDALAAMVALGHRLGKLGDEYNQAGHPLEITRDLSRHYQTEAEATVREANLAESMPRLAQLVAASPLEAAIHDAYGKALGANSYNLLGPDFVNRDLASHLTPEFAGEYLDRYTVREPKSEMPLYHLVGALDPLSESDVPRPVGDGLPETLGEWILADGLTHLKIKLAGDDLEWDVQRVAGVERVAAAAQQSAGMSRVALLVGFQRALSQCGLRAGFPRPAPRGFPVRPGAGPVHRAAHASGLASQPRKQDARCGQDQAGGD